MKEISGESFDDLSKRFENSTELLQRYLDNHHGLFPRSSHKTPNNSTIKSTICDIRSTDFYSNLKCLGIWGQLS